jgi:diguanylate cyclase (GGDEF)-like protein
MRLTVVGHSETKARRLAPLLTRPFEAAAVALLLFSIAWLDYSTGVAPVQHLYYLPIILAASIYDYTGGLACAVTAIGLYHLANEHLRTLHYGESDYLQIALFLIVGFVTARLSGDRRVMRRLAHTDDLTGLHNLRSFERELQKIISNAQARRTTVSMLVLDVDCLKIINDVHGHLAGAEAVREVGHLIALYLDANTVACRYGGDEFAIVISADESVALAAAERLRKAVESHAPMLAGKQFLAGALTISIGIAVYLPEPTSDPALGGEELFRAADLALYEAKRGGRNRVQLNTGTLKSSAAKPNGSDSK